MPPGLEFYTSVETYSEKCLIPCKGTYADVDKKEDFKKVEEIEKLRTTLYNYKEYKSGFFNGTEGNIGKLCTSLINHPILQVYDRRTKLHWVRIYFATPTFDRITKDEKANFEDKLSAIGGTMGLLTGFSIISGVEIIYFGIKIAVRFFKKRN